MTYLRPINKSNRILIFVVVLLILPGILLSQRRRDLESKRKKLFKNIKVTSKLLKTTTKNKAATLDRYIALQEQIQSREELLLTLEQEIQISEESIVRTDNVIESLRDDIAQLQYDYSIMARHAFRMKKNSNILYFIFSAGNFNEMIKRWRYLKRYDQYRKKQARLIISTQQSLESKITSLERKKDDKLVLIEKEETQKGLLEKELNTKEKLLSDLKRDEKRLKKELTKQKKAHTRLNNAIEDIIRVEIAERRRKERDAKLATSSLGKNSSTKVWANLSSNFKKNKGRLPWPVESGIITRKFGKQEHPTLKKVIIDNNGIDIQTQKSQEVRAVFGGKVKGTQFIPGYDYTIIIQHGDYYTVYSNLKEIYVKRGDVVKLKQSIGIVRTNPKTNKSEVHFEVWKEKKRLNPIYWVGKS